MRKVVEVNVFWEALLSNKMTFGSCDYILTFHISYLGSPWIVTSIPLPSNICLVPSSPRAPWESHATCARMHKGVVCKVVLSMLQLQWFQ